MKPLLITLVSLALAGLVLAIVWPYWFPPESPPREPRVRQSAYIPPRPTEVDLPPLTWSEVSAAAGLDFRHETGAFTSETGDSRYLPECMGPGVVLFDADGDGDSDVYIPNGSDFPGHLRQRPLPTGRLFRNDGEFRFTDVTDAAELGFSFYGIGGAAADWDGDGDCDLTVTGWGGIRMLRNEGSLRFVDVTKGLGLELPGWTNERNQSGPDWTSSAVWFDADGDDDLDLFVACYARWSPETDVFATIDGRRKSFTVPEQYPGSSSRLFRNDGAEFTDITKASGIWNESGKALGVAVWDFEGDGRLDLVVANDKQPNFFFRNLGQGRFEERASDAGIAFDEDARTRAGMGIDVADYGNDGVPGIPIGNFSGEEVALYRMDAPVFFRDVNQRVGIGAATKLMLTFGLLFADFDLDGWQDLALANGHLEPHVQEVQRSISYAQPTQILRNQGTSGLGKFANWGPALGEAINTPIVGRGLAVADVDGDGDLDLLVGNNGGPLRAFRNDLSSNAGWLRVRLVGRAPNTHALGAWVIVTSGDLVQRRMVRTGSSYGSQSELTQTFGLGAKTRVDRLEVAWPNGRRSVHEVAELRTTLVIEQEP